jgi:hypothetical protein
MLSPQRKSSLPTTAEAFPGRETAICISDKVLAGYCVHTYALADMSCVQYAFVKQDH